MNESPYWVPQWLAMKLPRIYRNMVTAATSTPFLHYRIQNSRGFASRCKQIYTPRAALFPDTITQRIVLFFSC
ncbi:hypothetical protein B0H19DRAFT_1194049 [Mycena capillaripes]|nr:hypothetical protein B0H19DRAFT_1194049 [Mycena capillaripes]